MALSARDLRILNTIEEDLAAEDRAWVARFGRLAESRHHGPLRRQWKFVVALLFWVGLVCADATTHQGILLWIAGAAGVGGAALLVWRRRAVKPAAALKNPSRKSLNS